MRKLTVLLIVLLASPIVKAQWEKTNGPYMSSNYISMDVNQIVIGGNNLCAIINNQVYLSLNNGVSWMLASGELNYVRSIAYSDSTIYAGTNGSGIFRSTNNGSSFQAINNNLPDNAVIDVMLASGNLLLAEVSTAQTPYFRELNYSIDKGNTWLVANGLSNKYVKSLTNDGTNFYAGTTYGVYKSTDNGLNWSIAGLPEIDISSIAVKGNTVIASENKSTRGLYLSDDQGSNWTELKNGLPNTYISAVAANDNYIYAGVYWDGVYRSADHGASWSLMNNGFIYSKDIVTLATKGNYIFAGSNSGCAISTDQGSTWYCGPSTYDLSVKSIVTACNNVIAATNYMMYKSIDNGANWDTFQVSMNALATEDSIVYAGGDGGMTISTDCGSHWSSANIVGLPDNPRFTHIITNDSVKFVATLGKGVFYSKDDGHNWEARNDGLNDLIINSLASIDTILFAGSNTKGVFVSFDSGLHWNSAGNGIADTCIQTLASYTNILYAGTRSHGIYKSTNHGASWEHLTTGVAGTDIQCIYTCGVNVFAGLRGEGFFVSPDNGNSWAAQNSGLINYNIQTISENGNEIYAGTTGAGIWKRSLSEFPLTLSIKKIKITDASICQGYSSTIQANVVGGKSPYTYTWDNGNHTSAITVAPLTTTTYHLTVTDSDLKSITTDVTIKVKPKPETPFIAQSGNILYSSASEGNIWMINGQVLYNEHSDKIQISLNGKYTVVVIQNGCVSDTSNEVPVGIEESKARKNIELYPNPATNKVAVEILSNEKDFHLILYDMKGNEILKQDLIESKTPIDISTLNKGVYYVKIMNDNFIEVKFLVVQ